MNSSNNTILYIIIAVLLCAHLYLLPEYLAQKKEIEVLQSTIAGLSGQTDSTQQSKSAVPALPNAESSVAGKEKKETSEPLAIIEEVRALGMQLKQEYEQIKTLEGQLGQMQQSGQMTEQFQKGVQIYQQKAREFDSGRQIYMAKIEQLAPKIEALSASPQATGGVKLALAFVAGEKGEYLKKVTLIEEASKTTPLSLKDRLDLAYTYEQVNLLPKASSLLQSILETEKMSDEDKKQVQSMLAQEYFWLEKFDLALALYKELEADPRWKELISQPKELALNYQRMASEEEGYRKADKDLPLVEITTSKGKIKAQLFENDAPNAVANFVSLAQSKFYDGTKFHRVIPKFMAQGGDPNSKDNDPANDGQGGPGYKIKTEISKRNHFRGVLSFANAGLNTDGSQFFITTVPTPWLNQRHAVFGRVLEGMEIADSLAVGDLIEKVVVTGLRKHPYAVQKLAGQ